MTEKPLFLRLRVDFLEFLGREETPEQIQMRRPLLIFLLSLGTVAGYASGFHSLRMHSRWHDGGACGWHDEAAPSAPPPAAPPSATPSTPAP